MMRRRRSDITDQQIEALHVVLADEKISSHLRATERIVLELKYGLTDGIRRSDQEVGDEVGLSRARTRQIDREARLKLFRLTDNLQVLPDPDLGEEILKRRSEM